MLDRRQFLTATNALLLSAATGTLATAVEAPKPLPPVAPRSPERMVTHGIERIDDYAWLKDPNWRDAIKDTARLSPNIRAYIDAENAYAEAAFAPLTNLRATLEAELRGRIEQSEMTVPAADGPYRYWSRHLPGAEQPQYVREPVDGGPVEVLLDADAMAKGRTYFSLGAVIHSPNHKLLGYLADSNGSKSFDLYIRPIGSAALLPPSIVFDVSEFAWGTDGESLVYVRRDEEMRARLVYRHRVGSAPNDDQKIYEEEDLSFAVSVTPTSTRRRIAITTSSSDTSEVWLLDATAIENAPVLVAPRREQVQYYVEDWEDQLVVRTNADQAADFKVVTASVAEPGPAHWKDLVPYRPGIQIENILTRMDHMARIEMEDGQQRLVVRNMRDGSEYTETFSEDAYTLWIGQPYNYREPVIRVGYSSPITPQQVFEYDMAARKLTLKRQQRIPSGLDPSAYVVRRIFAPAADGETIPITLVHRRGLAIDGSAPAILTGYGAYATNMTPEFNENAFSLVDRGFVYARAHVRGGLEKGDRWREGGRLKNKMNTFTDFIAATEHLIRLGYTAKGRIVANGASAGGLLVGAVANMRPDLYGGMIAQVPFVDVLSTMLDAHLPLTTTDRPEWGDPIADVDAYRTIATYSPYDNVKAQNYPPLFVTAGISDPRVGYWEPAKWVAKLRATKTNNNPLVLRTRMAGHFGAPGRFQGIEDVAAAYAFVLEVLGMRDVPLAPAPGAKGP